MAKRIQRSSTNRPEIRVQSEPSLPQNNDSSSNRKLLQEDQHNQTSVDQTAVENAWCVSHSYYY